MKSYRCGTYWKTILALICTCLLLSISACQSSGVQSATKAVPTTPSPTTPAQGSSSASPILSPTEGTHTPTATATPAVSPTATPVHINYNRPVLAFYYMWYSPSTWCSCHMSDLPTIQYNSSDNTTIDRQLIWAAQAGITGFISSWWGPGDPTDTNFARLLAHSATLENTTGYHFASTIYFESDAPALDSTQKMVSALQYAIAHYSNDPHFFHWHGKPVLFFWNPLGKGRTLSDWASRAC